jgi:hypothetical protein
MLHPVPKPAKRPKPDGRLFPDREDPEYLVWIRTFPCACCFAEGRAQRFPTEVEHHVGRAQGGYDRGDTFPTCLEHREMKHVRMGSRAFARYCRNTLKLDLDRLTKRLAQQYEADLWPCP